jgi:zinc D-Ala-D-Ala dipeptidase
MPSSTPDSLRDLTSLLSSDGEFVNLRKFPAVTINLKYATTDNFMRTDVYGPFREAFLHREAAGKFEVALQALARENPGFRLRVFDALRPRSVQRLLYRFVEGTPDVAYVANPERGSMHNYGCAIDLTAMDPTGKDLDMGTGFDAFDPLSEPKREAEFLASGRLTPVQLENRLILRRAMEEGGFIQLPHEWWHFNAFPEAEVRGRFKIVE